MLTLYVDAPFAVCRTFTAGWYRPTATFLTPSAAYGLLLNLAGMESRLREEDAEYPPKLAVPTTMTRSGLPPVRVAIGASAVRRIGRRYEAIPDEADRFPHVQTVYQQLHNYPVGSSGGERAATTFGSKYNITPVRREVLVGLRALVVVDGEKELETAIHSGLDGRRSNDCYGLPFLGDNAFLPDRIELAQEPVPAHWYEVVEGEAIRPRATRLTVWIDRADFSRTRSNLYAPSTVPTTEVPPRAWTSIEPRA